MQPLEPINLASCKDLADLLECMAKTSFGARKVGQAFRTLKKIADDRECSVVLTVSGALTVAKLGGILSELINAKMIQLVVTTGAIITHSLVEEMGLRHFEAPDMSDRLLYEQRLNRIYDSIEPEANLQELERLTAKAVSKLDPGRRYGSYEFISTIAGKLLSREGGGTGFVTGAVANQVDVFVPALADSELGLYLYKHSQDYCPFRDLDRYRSWLESRGKIAFLTLGGGVPRNWAQQMLPYLSSLAHEGASISLPEVVAAIRICPDPASLGHLSGSTYSEGVSWGKFDVVHAEDYVEIHADATIVFPILAKAILDYLKMNPKKVRQE